MFVPNFFSPGVWVGILLLIVSIPTSLVFLFFNTLLDCIEDERITSKIDQLKQVVNSCNNYKALVLFSHIAERMTR